MFDLAASPIEVSDDHRRVFTSAWEQIAGPGTWFGSTERVAIAETARAARVGDEVPDVELPAAATEAAAFLAATPSFTTRSWVEEMAEKLGETRYVELVGIVARVVAIDTVTRLLGCELEPFPSARPGSPTEQVADGTARKGKAWINMIGFPVPPNVLSVVPAAKDAMNHVVEFLYMTGEQMEDPDITLGDLHRSQIELVAATVSQANECFY